MAALTRLAQQERSSTAELLAGLEEFDRRRLYLGLGFSSLYAYCRDALHLTDGAAYTRIEVARASRQFPVLLDMVRDGRLSLATACLVCSKLAADTADSLLAQVAGKSKREVEAVLAARNPKPPVPSMIRKLPEAGRKPETAANVQSAPDLALQPVASLTSSSPPPTPSSRRPILAPLSEAHYKLQVTISTRAHDRLRQIQDLMRHRLPSGDPAVIVEQALEGLYAELLKKKAADVAKPRTTRESIEAKGRHVPASVKRAVWKRDEGRCAFVAEGGKRCGATGELEYHHVQPYAAGGAASINNIEMRCRAHNGFEWEQHLEQETEGLLASLDPPGR